MMADDDNDKTVFGQPLPGAPRPDGGRGGQPPAGRPAQGSGEKTVFGQPLPPAGSGPGRVAPASAPQNPNPWHSPGGDDTWLGGALNPQPGYPPQAPAPTAQGGYGGQPPQQPAYPGGYGYGQQPPPPQQGWGQQPQPAARPGYQPATGQRPAGSDIFPEIQRPEDQRQPQLKPRIALSDALKGTGLGAGGSTNPLIASAANLLILLGRLRTGLVEMQAGPLIDHVTREIDLFERNALAAGVSQQDASDAKYVLSATADDIVQNLPGADRGTWLEYSMVARFFGERSSGVGFFQKVDEAMRAPGQRFYLLELMLTCLSLGFEGQYRTLPNGSVELSRIRTAIYETLRRIQPRPDDDISVKWQGVPLGGKKRRGGVPVWVIGAIAATMLVALFATLSTLLTRQGMQVQDGILALHAGQPTITIERTEPVLTPYQAPESGQLQRMRTALSDEIEAGQLEVDQTNDWVYVRVGEALKFATASAELTQDFSALAEAIARTLDAEEGPIRVVGHSDNIPFSGGGRYKTNQQLSEARAQTVADILTGLVADPARITVEGKGATEPVADNATAEGRAENRRVEIMIPREE